MYFWKIEDLKEGLKKQPLSERESLKYLIAIIFLYSLQAVPMFENNIFDVWLALMLGIVDIFGVYYIYRCNGGSGGTNFLQKYLSLGWVVGIRWIVLVMFPITVLYYVGMEVYVGMPEYTTGADVVFFSLLGMGYVWLLGKHIKDLAKK